MGVKKWKFCCGLGILDTRHLRQKTSPDCPKTTPPCIILHFTDLIRKSFDQTKRASIPTGSPCIMPLFTC